MPAKDPKSPAHHLRIGQLDAGMEEYLSGLKGWVVVRHEGGAKGEHPHLHCYIQHDKDMTFMTVKNHLWKHELFSGLKGNGAFSQRPHNSLEAWWSYVWKDDYGTKRPRMVCWNLDIPQFDIPITQTLLIDSPTRFVTLPDTPETKVVVVKPPPAPKKHSADKQKLFTEYCRKWFEEFNEAPNSYRISKLLYHYFGENTFNAKSSLFIYGNYAYYQLVGAEQREAAAERFADRYHDEIFS